MDTLIDDTGYINVTFISLPNLYQEKPELVVKGKFHWNEGNYLDTGHKIAFTGLHNGEKLRIILTHYYVRSIYADNLSVLHSKTFFIERVP